MSGCSASAMRGRECATQTDEQRLEGERRIEVELLERAPGLTDGLGRFDGAVHRGEGHVLVELLEPVCVYDGRVRLSADDDEVAVPGFETLERGEHLVALGAALGARGVRFAAGRVDPGAFAAALDRYAAVLHAAFPT